MLYLLILHCYPLLGWLGILLHPTSTRSKEHPGLAALLDAAVAGHNAEVERKNAVIHGIAALPIFQPT